MKTPRYIKNRKELERWLEAKVCAIDDELRQASYSLYSSLGFSICVYGGEFFVERNGDTCAVVYNGWSSESNASTLATLEALIDLWVNKLDEDD